jgi:hypothetical protein
MMGAKNSGNGETPVSAVSVGTSQHSKERDGQRGDELDEDNGDDDNDYD